jgi:carbamoyltransferase
MNRVPDARPHMTSILGISAFYHDSAACLVRDGEIVAAAQEERFTRRKHDPAFPRHAIRYCLQHTGIELADLDYAVFYEKPLVKFERLLETYLAFAPRGLRSFVMAMPVWLREKLFLKDLLRSELASLSNTGELTRRMRDADGGTRTAIGARVQDSASRVGTVPPLLFAEHHESHAASAFYPSPFESAAILCLDGVGEWATTSAWRGQLAEIEPLWEIPFPHSLGLLYSAFTYHAGFKVNSGEHKLMGLAPYGEPTYAAAIYDHLIDVKADGTFRLNLDYFDYCTGFEMTNGRFAALVGGPPRGPDAPITRRELDLARSIQVVTEEIMLRLARTVHAQTGLENLCLAGGVALNCVASGRILREGPFRRMWIQPAAGDAGGALGAALAAWHRFGRQPRTPASDLDAMSGSLLGPSFSNDEIESLLAARRAPYDRVDDERLFDRVARELAAGKVVGWFQGRMEFGPRALGARSILGDPRSPSMQSTMNLKIKFRESFRPFAPSVLRERLNHYFELDTDTPYMLLVAPVHGRVRVTPPPGSEALRGLDRLRVVRSAIPAVTHVDYSARIQSVDRETNPRYRRLLEAFEALTGCGVLVNTSFNVRGEPIVCTPDDAYRCFMRTAMDVLVMENCVLEKSAQHSAVAMAEPDTPFEPD